MLFFVRLRRKNERCGRIFSTVFHFQRRNTPKFPHLNYNIVFHAPQGHFRPFSAKRSSILRIAAARQKLATESARRPNMASQCDFSFEKVKQAYKVWAKPAWSLPAQVKCGLWPHTASQWNLPVGQVKYAFASEICSACEMRACVRVK